MHYLVMSEAEVAAIAGEDAVYYATKLSGASNAKATRVLVANLDDWSGSGRKVIVLFPGRPGFYLDG